MKLPPRVLSVVVRQPRPVCGERGSTAARGQARPGHRGRARQGQPGGAGSGPAGAAGTWRSRRCPGTRQAGAPEPGSAGSRAGWGAGTGPAGQAPGGPVRARDLPAVPRPLLTGAHPPRKFLMTSFLEPPAPPGLAGPPVNVAGLVRPLVRPMRAETLPFRGPSSAMAGPDAAPPRAARLLLLPCAPAVRVRLLLLLLPGSALERSAPPPAARGPGPRARGPNGRGAHRNDPAPARGLRPVRAPGRTRPRGGGSGARGRSRTDERSREGAVVSYRPPSPPSPNPAASALQLQGSNVTPRAGEHPTPRGSGMLRNARRRGLGSGVLQ